jgi:hypothetical protein
MSRHALADLTAMLVMKGPGLPAGTFMWGR